MRRRLRIPAAPVNGQYGFSIVSLLTLIVTSIGIFYVLVELAIARFDRSVDQTLSFVERFNGPDLIKARSAVQKPWLEIGVQLAKLDSGAGFSEEQIIQLTSGIMQADREQSGELLVNVLLITSFFDELSTCMEFSCNPDVACKYFSKTVADFRMLYGNALSQMAHGFDMGGIGYGLRDPKLALGEDEKCQDPKSWPLYFALSRH